MSIVSYKLKKVCVLGHFGIGKDLLNGQTVKTKIVTNELQRQLGEERILRIDTCGGAKTLLKAPLQVFSALQKAENVIIFPAHNGLRVYAPLIAFMKKFFKGRKVHYAVIGGWLPQFLNGKKLLENALKKFDGIYVETTGMEKALVNQGFKNIVVMPNCKDLSILNEEQFIYNTKKPYKLCTFFPCKLEKRH